MYKFTVRDKQNNTRYFTGPLPEMNVYLKQEGYIVLKWERV